LCYFDVLVIAHRVSILFDSTMVFSLEIFDIRHTQLLICNIFNISLSDAAFAPSDEPVRAVM